MPSGIPDLLLSSWITEAARAAVLSGSGRSDAAVRAQARARLIARVCDQHGVKIVPRFASAHAEWMAAVAGTEEETGALGWFFLQRLGMFVDAHLSLDLTPQDHQMLVELGLPDVDEVNAAIGSLGLGPNPEPEWPKAPRAAPRGPLLGKIAILGDPHIGLKASNQLIPAALDSIESHSPDLIVAIGDITQNGKEEHFIHATKIFARQTPMMFTLGNHDMWGRGVDEPQGTDFLDRHLGSEPYGVHHAGRFSAIVLNSADPRPSPFPPFDLMLGSFTEGPKESMTGGSFGEEVMGFIDQVETDGPTFIFLHHPPFPYLGLPPLVFGLDEPSTTALLRLAHRVGARAVFCGHTHRSARYTIDGIEFVEVPSSKEWPFGYGVIEITESGFTFNLEPIDAPQLVSEASRTAGTLFRRYARGPDEARSFSV